MLDALATIKSNMMHLYKKKVSGTLYRCLKLEGGGWTKGPLLTHNSMLKLGQIKRSSKSCACSNDRSNQAHSHNQPNADSTCQLNLFYAHISTAAS